MLQHKTPAKHAFLAIIYIVYTIYMNNVLALFNVFSLLLQLQRLTATWHMLRQKFWHCLMFFLYSCRYNV